MTPYYDADGITIYHGDCMEVLPSLGAPVADMLLTDIPYGEVTRPCGNFGDSARSFDKGDADLVTFELDAFVAMVVLACRSSFYVFCGIEQVSPLTVLFKQRGLTTRHGLWIKSNPSPVNGEHLWLSGHENCVFARAPLAPFSEHCAPPHWRYPVGTSKRHPTEKPRALFDRLVLASSKPGETVLDPCAGSGTALEAALQLGRRAIGVELNEEYCEIAAKRLAQGVLDFGGAA